jgi:hypothetical protein
MPRCSGARLTLRGVNMADPVIPVLIPRRRVSEITAEVAAWVQQQIDASRKPSPCGKPNVRR